MKFINNKLFLALFFISFSASSAVIDMDDAFKLASESRPEYLSAKTELQKAKLRYKSLYKNYLPKISAKASKRKTDKSTAIGKNTLETTDLGIEASINLFRGFQDKSNFNKEDAGIQKAKLNLELIDAEITYDIKTSFFNYYYLSQLKILLEKIKDRRKEQMELIELRFEGGREDKGSYLQSKVKYLEAEDELKKVKRDIRASFENLRIAIGVENEEIKIKERSLREFIPNEKKDDLVYKDSIVLGNPKYLLSKLDLYISKEEIDIEDSSFFPTLDLNASHGVTGEDNHLNENTWSVGLTLSIPLFEGGSRVYNSKIARRNKILSEFNLRQSFNSLKLSFIKAFNDFKDAKEGYSLQSEYLKALSIRDEVVTSQYQNGLMTYTNWDLVQSEFIKYQKSNLSALKTLLEKGAEIKKLSGIGELK